MSRVWARSVVLSPASGRPEPDGQAPGPGAIASCGAAAAPARGSGRSPGTHGDKPRGSLGSLRSHRQFSGFVAGAACSLCTSLRVACF